VNVAGLAERGTQALIKVQYMLSMMLSSLVSTMLPRLEHQVVRLRMSTTV
jgi:hypothetical protein